jgi:hypothetical protein
MNGAESDGFTCTTPLSDYELHSNPTCRFERVWIAAFAGMTTPGTPADKS